MSRQLRWRQSCDAGHVLLLAPFGSTRRVPAAILTRMRTGAQTGQAPRTAGQTAQAVYRVAVGLLRHASPAWDAAPWAVRRRSSAGLLRVVAGGHLLRGHRQPGHRRRRAGVERPPQQLGHRVARVCRPAPGQARRWRAPRRPAARRRRPAATPARPRTRAGPAGSGRSTAACARRRARVSIRAQASSRTRRSRSTTVSQAAYSGSIARRRGSGGWPRRPRLADGGDQAAARRLPAGPRRPRDALATCSSACPGRPAHRLAGSPRTGATVAASASLLANTLALAAAHGAGSRMVGDVERRALGRAALRVSRRRRTSSACPRPEQLGHA